jgi:hypothetical protein
VKGFAHSHAADYFFRWPELDERVLIQLGQAEDSVLDMLMSISALLFHRESLASGQHTLQWSDTTGKCGDCPAAWPCRLTKHQQFLWGMQFRPFLQLRVALADKRTAGRNNKNIRDINRQFGFGQIFHVAQSHASIAVLQSTRKRHAKKDSSSREITENMLDAPSHSVPSSIDWYGYVPSLPLVVGMGLLISLSRLQFDHLRNCFVGLNDRQTSIEKKFLLLKEPTKMLGRGLAAALMVLMACSGNDLHVCSYLIFLKKSGGIVTVGHSWVALWGRNDVQLAFFCMACASSSRGSFPVVLSGFAFWFVNEERPKRQLLPRHKHIIHAA